MVVTSSESSDQQSNESITAGVETFTSDGSTRPVRRDERPSTTVILTIAATLDVDPIELTPPLHDFVDPDALDTLIMGNKDDYWIEFDAYDCRITVDGATVTVHSTSSESAPFTDEPT